MGYRPALDGLRAVAIGLVLLEHTGLELFDGGNSGVIVFFALSGFLITKLMIEEWDKTGGLNIKAFYGRRAVRIMPAPIVMVLVVFALSWHLAPDADQRRYLWFELVMVLLYLYSLRPILFGNGGWFGAERGPETTTYMAHTWSLAVEEHFYLVWPWLLRWMKLPSLRPERVINGLLWFTIAVTVSRFVIDRFADPDVVSISLFSFDGFALGAALAFAIHHDLWPRARRILQLRWLPIAAGVILAIDLVGRNQVEGGAMFPYWYITYCSVASVVLIGCLYDGGDRGLVGAVLSWGPVVWIGKLSYSLYLWHVPVQVYVNAERFPEWSTARIIVVEQVVTFAAVLASYYLVEMPARRLRRFFVVSSEAGAEPVEPATAPARAVRPGPPPIPPTPVGSTRS